MGTTVVTQDYGCNQTLIMPTTSTIKRIFSCGTIYTGVANQGKPTINSKTIEIINPEEVPKDQRFFIATISLCLVTGQNGDFDIDDAVFCDIFQVDGCTPGKVDDSGNPTYDETKLGSSGLNVRRGFGGVWDYSSSFGGVPVSNEKFGLQGDIRNPGIGSYIGPINNCITFRVVNIGDNYVGASYLLIDLGKILNKPTEVPANDCAF